jgi:hypothetical protein
MKLAGEISRAECQGLLSLQDKVISNKIFLAAESLRVENERNPFSSPAEDFLQGYEMIEMAIAQDYRLNFARSILKRSAL